MIWNDNESLLGISTSVRLPLIVVCAVVASLCTCLLAKAGYKLAKQARRIKLPLWPYWLPFVLGLASLALPMLGLTVLLRALSVLPLKPVEAALFIGVCAVTIVAVIVVRAISGRLPADVGYNEDGIDR